MKYHLYVYLFFSKLDEILFLFVSIFDKSPNFSSYPLSFNNILDICIEFSISFSTDLIFRLYRSTIIYKIYTLIYIIYCCDNIYIGCKNYENICINSGTIHDYQYVNEISSRDDNMNISNILFYKKTIYKRKKYLYDKCLHIKEINENTILFFDNSLENIRKLYNLKRISITKYLNSIYIFIVIKVQLIINQFLEMKKNINLNDDIIEILEKNYLEYPYFRKNEDDYYYL